MFDTLQTQLGNIKKERKANKKAKAMMGNVFNLKHNNSLSRDNIYESNITEGIII